MAETNEFVKMYLPNIKTQVSRALNDKDSFPLIFVFKRKNGIGIIVSEALGSPEEIGAQLRTILQKKEHHD